MSQMTIPSGEKQTTMSWWARLIYGFVAVNALAGATILILFPSRTDALFFWPINPPINAALFGALYLCGAGAVSVAVWRNRWETARYLAPILVAAGISISGVTLLHLDKFTAGIRLAYWLVVYVGAPLLALLIYAHQERRGANWQVSTPVRPLTRWIALATGAVVALGGLGLIIDPQAPVAYWPWATTPLMVRIFAAWFLAFAIGLLWFAVERDWRRLAPIANLMMASVALDLLMVFVHRQHVTRTDFALWLYCGHLVVFGLVAVAMHVLQWRYAAPSGLTSGGGISLLLEIRAQRGERT